PTSEHAKAVTKTTYNEVMGKLLADKSVSRTNGYLILPILVVLLSVVSQIISTMQQKRAGQVNAQGGVATSMKVMMVIMPLMMAFFAVQYASIFAVYMVCNSAVTLFFNVVFSSIIKLMDKRKRTRNYGIASGSPRSSASAKASPIIHYVKGANPRAGEKLAPEPVPVAATAAQPGASGKKSKKSAPVKTAVRGGRPDPNELMDLDMSVKNKNKK
ncbi:MAG: hypothetical protein K2N74_00675, partial [Clostridiales bacterium]|nr:hypothetical protein [Clostridiales bacterium]